MKRELKAEPVTPLKRVSTAIARPIPMKRELKVEK